MIDRFKKVFFYSMIIGVIGGFFSFVGASVYTLYDYRKTRLLYDSFKGDKLYCVYNPFNFDLGYVYTMDDFDDLSSYKSYYKSQEKGIWENYSFDKTYSFVSQRSFIKSYPLDSEIVEIIRFDTICWTKSSVYVYKNLVFEKSNLTDSITNLIQRSAFKNGRIVNRKCNGFKIVNPLKKYVY